MVSVIIHSGAEDDTTESYLFYAKAGRGLAEKFEKQVRAAIDRIAADPSGGTSLDGNYRFYSLKSFPHLIVYRHAADMATVVAVYHPSREPAYWRNR